MQPEMKMLLLKLMRIEYILINFYFRFMEEKFWTKSCLLVLWRKSVSTNILGEKIFLTASATCHFFNRWHFSSCSIQRMTWTSNFRICNWVQSIILKGNSHSIFWIFPSPLRMSTRQLTGSFESSSKIDDADITFWKFCACYGHSSRTWWHCN